MDSSGESTSLVYRKENHSGSAAQMSKFLECQRCGSFLLTETSTAKRIHNVKCLSSAVIAKKSYTTGCAIFQGYSSKTFPFATVKLERFSDKDVARYLQEVQRRENIIDKKRIGRPLGCRSRNGVDIGNIIEESGGRPRRSYLKANAKFKEMEDGSASEHSDNERTTSGVAGTTRQARKRHIEDEDFTVDVTDQFEVEMDAFKGRKKETRGRKRKYEIPLTNREKYLIFSKKMSLEEVRANGPVCGNRNEHGKKIKLLTPQEKYYRYAKRVICKICKEPVKAYYLEMHVAHFHTEGHDQQHCNCFVNHCKALEDPKPVYQPKVVNGKISESKTSVKVTVKCTKCGKSILKSSERRHYRMHLRLAGSNSRKPCVKNIKCDVCQNKFATYHGLKTHFVAVHMTNTPFICRFDGCSYKGGDYHHLERHVGNHMEENKIFRCNQCGKRFTKFDTLLRHRNVCKEDNIDREFVGSPHMGKIWTKDVSIKEKSEDIKRVKTEVAFEVDSIHLYDKIIETEEGPVHIKGEYLDAQREISQYEQAGQNLHVNSRTAFNDRNNETEKGSPEDEKEWNEAKMREKISLTISSWDERLRDNAYLNSLIRQDPIFQKLEKENVEFANKIIRDGGRKNYFLVNKSTPKFAHRCNKCSRAFKRAWALQKHKNQNVCLFLTNGTVADNDDAKCNETPSSNSSRLTTTDANDNLMNFMCTGCGFQSKSAKELEKHMKTSPVHNKKWWRADKTQMCPKKCGAWFSTVKELNHHLDEIHMKTPKLNCQHCPKAFVNEKLLRNHIYFNHTRRSIIPCKKCGRQFRVKENCEKHEMGCKIEERRPKCMQCNEHFCNKTSLRRHVRSVHINKSASNNFQNGINENLAINETSLETNTTPVTQPHNEDDSMILGI